EFLVRAGCGRGQCTYYDVRTCWDIPDMRTHEVSQPTFHGVSCHRRSDCLRNDESGTCRVGTCRIDVIRGEIQMHHEGSPCRTPPLAYRRGEILPAAKARGGGQHLDSRLTSGRELGAALGPAGREDRAPGAGAHAQPEAVGLRTPTVVRLVGAL